MKANELLNRLESDLDAIIKTTTEIKNDKVSSLNWKASSKEWSVLECIAHLNRYCAYYLPEIERAMLKSKRESVSSLRSTWIGKKSIEMMHPSNTKKHRTFKRMDPAASALSLSEVDDFLAYQRKLHSLLTEAGKVDINASLVRAEFFKLLRLTIAEALQFILVHQQRHFLQIARIKENFKTLESPRLVV